MIKDNFFNQLLIAFTITSTMIFTYAVIDLNHKNKALSTELLSNTEVISDLQNQIDSFGELAMVYPENRAMVVAIAYSESRCSKTVKHPDSNTKGIGGIKTLWQLECEPNSLMAIEEVIENIREANPSFTDFEVIKFYKGAKSNLGSTNTTYELFTALKRIL